MPVWIDNDTVYTKALSTAMHAHQGQYRKYSRQPYIHHPIRVSETVRELFEHREEHEKMVAAALLHDVLEDTWMTEEDLRHMPKEVVELIKYLSEDKSLYIKKRRDLYRNQLEKSPEAAKLIKLADIWDNIRDWPERGNAYENYLRKSEKTLQYLPVEDAEGLSLKQEIQDIIDAHE